MKLSQVCQVNPPKKIDIPCEQEISFVPMEAVTTEGVLDTSRTILVSKVKNYSVFQNGDVLFAKITPCMENGKGCIAKGLLNGFGAGSTEFIVLRPNSDFVIAEWVFYFLSQKQFRLQCQHHMTGSAGQKRVPPKYLASCEIPIPSICEQKRIVARIEELFSQLDSGVETLQKTKRQLEVYRQAVLKEAFEGKLTKSWRKSHPACSARKDFDLISLKNQTFKDTTGDENELCLHLPQSWLQIRIGDVFKVEVGSTPSRRIPEYWGGSINWVSSGEVCFNQIFDTKEKITEYGLSHASTKVHPVDTVMLAMIGEGKTRGQAAILQKPAAHNQNTAAILVSETPCNPKYLYYFLLMNYENTRRVGSGNNQKALNKERVRALHIPFSSFAEQAAVVQQIESRLSICDCIEETIKTAMQQADTLKQGILKQSLAGESFI